MHKIQFTELKKCSKKCIAFVLAATLSVSVFGGNVAMINADAADLGQDAGIVMQGQAPAADSEAASNGQAADSGEDAVPETDGEAKPDQGETAQPDSTVPGTDGEANPDQDETTQPDSTVPGTDGAANPDQGETTQPDSTVPETDGEAKPDQGGTTQPDSTVPETDGEAKPDQGGTTQPDSTVPETDGEAKPDQGETAQPDGTVPGGDQGAEGTENENKPGEGESSPEETPDEEIPQDENTEEENFEDEVDSPPFVFEPSPADSVLQINNGRYETSIDLRNRYTISANFANNNGNAVSYYPGDAQHPDKLGSPAEIGTNYFKLGSRDYTVPNDGAQGNKQVVAATTSFQVNFSRPFLIKGKVRLTKSNQGDGMAIAFHNDPDFKARNRGGSYGIYYHRDNAHARERGLSYATVMEVDTFYNKEALAAYAEPTEMKSHIAVVETAEEGDALGNPNPNYIQGRKGLIAYNAIGNENLFMQLTDFQVEWLPKNKLEFIYGNPEAGNGYRITVPYEKLRYLAAITEGLHLGNTKQNGFGYITFASAIDMKLVGDPIYLELTEMRYTDILPKITVEPYEPANTYEELNRSQKLKFPYVMPGEKFGVMTTLENEKETTAKIDDWLYLNELRPSWTSGISILQKDSYFAFYNEEGNWYLYDKDPDKKFPLDVHFRSKTHPFGPAKYRYDVTPHNTLAEGNKGEITYQYNSGVLGMTQIVHKGSIPVRTRNVITSNNNKDFDFQKVDNPTMITEDKMWEGIKAKSSNSGNNTAWEDLNRNKLQNVQNMSVEYEYFVDGVSQGTTFPTVTENDRCKVYGLKVTIKDNNGDERLTNSVMKVMYSAEHSDYKDGRLIVADNSKTPITETKLSTWKAEDYKKEIIKNTNAKAFTYSVQDGLKLAGTVAVDFSEKSDKGTTWVNGRGMMDQVVGTHTIKMHIAESPNNVVRPTQEVTDNSWSYDNGVNAPDGNTGYIIIPSGIPLTRGENAVEGTATVKYSGYDSDKSYEVTVEPTIKLFSRLSPLTSFDVNITGEGTKDGKTLVGTLSRTITEKEIKLASNKEALNTTNVDDTWSGSLTFYIKRVAP